MRLRSLFIPSVVVAAVLGTRVATDPEAAVLQLFAWERDRLFTLAKGIAAAAVTVLTGLVASAIAGKVTSQSWVLVLDAVLFTNLLGWAGFVLTGLRRLAEEYPMALALVREGR
jgi:hypothetical protein